VVWNIGAPFLTWRLLSEFLRWPRPYIVFLLAVQVAVITSSILILSDKSTNISSEKWGFFGVMYKKIS
jgi:hypothetical protein